MTATKTVAGSFTPGSTVTYTVTLHNAGPADQADNPGDELTDVLPSSLTLVSASSPSGTATATVATNTVTWNGGIPAGGDIAITIQAKVNSDVPAGTAIDNQATAAFDADGNGTNEAATPTDDPAQPGAGDPTSFTVAAVTAPAEVPTLGSFGLVLLGALLALGGARVMRRKAFGRR